MRTLLIASAVSARTRRVLMPAVVGVPVMVHAPPAGVVSTVVPTVRPLTAPAVMMVLSASTSLQLSATKTAPVFLLVLAMVTGVMGIAFSSASMVTSSRFSVGTEEAITVKITVASSRPTSWPEPDRARMVKVWGVPPVRVPLIKQARPPVAVAMVRRPRVPTCALLSLIKKQSVISAPPAALTMDSSSMAMPSMAIAAMSSSGRLGAVVGARDTATEKVAVKLPPAAPRALMV